MYYKTENILNVKNLKLAFLMGCLTLSYWLNNDSPVHNDLKKPFISSKSVMKDDGYNTYLITIENHSGTHIDAPRHFIETGRRIASYSPEELFFKNPIILECPKDDNEFIQISDLKDVDLEGVDCLFIRTGFGKYRETDPDRYLSQNPGISPKTVEWLRKNFQSIRCLGLDCVSISGYQHGIIGRETHLMAFEESMGKPLLLVEDLNLKPVVTDLKWIMIIPWQLDDVDSAPCTVIASEKLLINEKK
jgi:kynurenine formamidase